MSIHIGYKFKSKCGFDLEIINIEKDYCLVTDTLGNQKSIPKDSLKKMSFKWTYNDGLFCPNKQERSKDIKIGDLFDSKTSGKFQIVEKTGHTFTVKFIDTGYIKKKCKRHVVLAGSIKDKMSLPKHIKDFPIGTLVELSDCVIEVLAYENKQLLCKVLGHDVEQLIPINKLKEPSKARLFKEPAPLGYYIYYAWKDSDVVYVGRGKRFRYKHVNSGRSSNRELNRLHFQGVEFRISIEEVGLSYEESKLKEKIHISKFDKLFNEIIYKDI